MDIKKIAKSIGYKDAGEMFRACGYDRSNFSRLTDERKKNMIDSIILKHYNISSERLIEMINLSKEEFIKDEC